MVLILNGNGFNHFHYNYLQKHLARNSFMVASIEWHSGTVRIFQSDFYVALTRLPMPGIFSAVGLYVTGKRGGRDFVT